MLLKLMLASLKIRKTMKMILLLQKTVTKRTLTTLKAS